MDIGAGILLAFVTGHLWGTTVTWQLVGVGVAGALFPDIDLLLERIPPVQRIIGSHRSALHYPIVCLLVGLCCFLLFGSVLGTAFVVGILFHLVHDTFFLGWGIKWLWPFSHTALSLLHERHGRLTTDMLLVRLDNEEAIKKQYPSPDWIRSFYLRPSFVSLTEYPVFLVGLFLLVRHFFW